jgi:Domain of unknown function (DUF2828).
MFEATKTTLFKTPSTSASTTTTTTPFVKAAKKKSAETLSGNGALKYENTDNPFIDQFGNLGNYKAPRPYAEIAADCETLWATGKHRIAIAFMLYIRMITRVVVLFSGVSTKASQKGAELRHEGIMRMVWLHARQEDIFWKNIGLFVSVGSWKDITTMLQYDLMYHGWAGRVLNWNKFGDLILSALKNPATSELLKKYLPQIKTNSACKTVASQADNILAKWICSLVFGGKESSANYKKYRQLKTSGTAHQWQQLISKRKFEEIDFATIHGRALHLLVKSKFLKNAGLEEKYKSWITAPETVAVKFTGFVHELFKGLGANGTSGYGFGFGKCKYPTLTDVPLHEQETINKQFATLVEKGKAEKEGMSGLIVVRDTSGSMSAEAQGSGMTCYAVAKALALYFSEFLKGRFSNSWIEFNTKAKMHTWKGKTPLEKWFNDGSGFVGNTNFQSVINLFCALRTDIPEEDFPTGILCISDGEFNPAHAGKTNVSYALQALRDAGFSEEYVKNFVIVLWNLQSRYYGPKTGSKFETYETDTPGVFYMSGYSASTVAFVTSKIKNAQELFDEAMGQEILQMVEV